MASPASNSQVWPVGCGFALMDDPSLMDLPSSCTFLSLSFAKTYFLQNLYFLYFFLYFYIFAYFLQISIFHPVLFLIIVYNFFFKIHIFNFQKAPVFECHPNLAGANVFTKVCSFIIHAHSVMKSTHYLLINPYRHHHVVLSKK